jgi:hypothetical protein
MDARRPVVIEKYSIHCLRIPLVTKDGQRFLVNR